MALNMLFPAACDNFRQIRKSAARSVDHMIAVVSEPNAPNTENDDAIDEPT